MKSELIESICYYKDPFNGRIIEGEVISHNGGWRAKALGFDINEYYTIKLNQLNSNGCDTVIVLKNQVMSTVKRM